MSTNNNGNKSNNNNNFRRKSSNNNNNNNGGESSKNNTKKRSGNKNNMFKRKGKSAGKNSSTTGNNNSNNNSNKKQQGEEFQFTSYPNHYEYNTCLERYNTKDSFIIRGRLRVLPKKNGMAFVTCDRGTFTRDILIETPLQRNRALDGDDVFVELLRNEEDEEIEIVTKNNNNNNENKDIGDLFASTTTKPNCGDDGDGDDVVVINNNVTKAVKELSINNNNNNKNEKEHNNNDKEENDNINNLEFEDYDIDDDDAYGDGRAEEEKVETWQDDAVQMELWAPAFVTKKAPVQIPDNDNDKKGQQQANNSRQEQQEHQQKGKVVCVIPPKGPMSNNTSGGRRVIVGTVKRIEKVNKKNKSIDWYYKLIPNNKSLPEFLVTGRITMADDDGGRLQETTGKDNDDGLYKAEYVYGSWETKQSSPPCVNVIRMGSSCNVEDETMALLTEFDVDHGDFNANVFKDVDNAVKSGLFHNNNNNNINEQIEESKQQQQDSSDDELGWKPTPDMYKGRRDYRKTRIFTIDPTTAKDLDDALHITPLQDGRVEIGVHIADVSHFVQTGTAVDVEAERRATTIYLVDRTVPMLPRPLCEVACSLNENVERLAFSCVWRMNIDGTLENKTGKDKHMDVWYGRSVIKSCARLDYSTAQNIIENKIATGESVNELDDQLWPTSRRPTGGHTIDDVAADVRLMNRVAKARRALRYKNGAIALNGIKLSFQLDTDGETPMLCEPYPIRDSNRLIEEYMLLANYLVAQRLITHAHGLALLRRHPPPLKKGLDDVVDIAQSSMGFDIDATSSQALQASLSKLGRECDDELVLQCITEMLMIPMQQAEYMAAGEVEQENWRHFALNIPYYTHFTSPIRRYPDIIVHRLLQATLDGQDAVDSFPIGQGEIQAISNHSNDKKMASKKAQDRSDRVFLALYLRKHPIKNQLGVVLSIGQKTFTVFVPSLGLSTLVFLDEHMDKFKFSWYRVGDENRICIEPRKKKEKNQWGKLDIKVFQKILVSCHCKEKPPIDVKVMVEGPYTE